MAFVKVVLMKDLEAGHMIGVEASGKEIVVINLEGTVYAIGNRCTHMGCKLSDGTLRGGKVACPFTVRLSTLQLEA